MYRIVACFLLFLTPALVNAASDLFGAISVNSMPKVDELLANDPTSINCSLSQAEGGALEKGMTPLLYALSLERLAIVKMLLAQEIIDVNLKNHAGVSAVHMLIMVYFGDELYCEDGVFNQRARMMGLSPGDFSSPRVKEQEIIEIFELLVNRGFNQWGNLVTSNNGEQNLISEAIAHGKPYIVPRILSNGGIAPDVSQSFRISGYIEGAKTLDDLLKRYENIMQLAISPEIKKELSSPSKIKQFLFYEGHDDHRIELVNSLRKNYKDFGGTVKACDFSGFLEGCGSDFPENVKDRLRD